MTGPDDDAIARRYRDGAREEPSATLDAAILAASRRAVGAGPRRHRWAVPVSIAAVLMLGIGISIRMQTEQPGIETSPPGATVASEYALPQAAEPAAPAQSAPPPQRADDAGAANDARRPIKPADLPPEAVPAPATPAPASSPPAAIPPRGSSVAPMAASAPPAAEAQPRARREAFALEKRAARDPREEALERIARLRGEGRNDEADKALEAFRREHPDYRIPDAVWERVRPR
jgi:Meckel syndrome type 1 protein